MFIANEKFSSPIDIRQKVDQTVIRYNGKAFYARHNGESESITLYRVGPKDEDLSERAKKVSYNDPLLDFSSPPLGFMNTEHNTCVFLSRIPSRRFQSGLSMGALEGTTLNGSQCSVPINFPWSDELRCTIEDIYPTAREVLKKNRNNTEPWSQAFSRILAFGFSKTNGLRLFHKHTTIALYEKGTGFIPVRSVNFLVDTILHKHELKNYAA